MPVTSSVVKVTGSPSYARIGRPSFAEPVPPSAAIWLRLMSAVETWRLVGDRDPRQATLRVSDDVSAAAWIGRRLGGDFGAVIRSVPSGYPAYARICHPAADRDGAPVTWGEVAQVTGRQIHPLMQWHAVAGSPDPLNIRGSLWSGSEPKQGHLVSELLGRLCELLADHTTTVQRCFFCLWQGYGLTRGPSAIPVSPALSFKGARRRRVHLSGRDHVLLAGPLPAALQIGWWHSANWFEPRSPNLFWPADQAWCVASEIDFDSTLIGGSTELIDAILHAPRFDSWPLQPDDSLAAYSDCVNRVP
jgi:hypothetical protein